MFVSVSNTYVRDTCTQISINQSYNTVSQQQTATILQYKHHINSIKTAAMLK